MMQEINQKLKELFNDKEYVNCLISLENNEKVMAELKNKGVDLNIEQTTRIVDLLKKQQKCELTDKELESVAGGFYVVY